YAGLFSGLSDTVLYFRKAWKIRANHAVFVNRREGPRPQSTGFPALMEMEAGDSALTSVYGPRFSRSGRDFEDIAMLQTEASVTLISHPPRYVRHAQGDRHGNPPIPRLRRVAKRVDPAKKGNAI